MRQLCLVTGATGFIGGQLAKRLVQSGHAVRCLARSTSNTAELERLDVQIAPGDLTDPASVASAAKGVTHILHCGALVSDWATVPEIRRVNVDGTRHILQAARQAGVNRFIHVSSTDVYGHPRGLHEIDEAEPPSRFSNWYSRTKLEAESEVRRAVSAGGVQAVVLRPATVYGPGSVSVVGEIAKAIRGRNMLLIDRGRALAGLCYIDNLIDAAMLALSRDGAVGHTFNVTDGLDITWRRFLEDLADGLGSPPPRLSLPYPVAHALGSGLERSYRLLRTATGLRTPALLSRQAVDVMGRDQCFSNQRIRRRLGWEPAVGYESGLRSTLTWLTTSSS